jgi:lipopolysaccharide export system permease protein
MGLAQSLRFIELAVSNRTSVIIFFELIFFIMPSVLTVILPITLFIVVLFIYNKLINDQEIIVLQSTGFSYWTIAQPALILATISTLLGLILNIWVVPHVFEKFHKLRWSLNSNVSNIIQEGRFNQIGTGLTIYIKNRSSNDEMSDIIVYDSRNSLNTITMMSKSGILVKTDNDTLKLMMINGIKQEVTRGSDRLSVLYFDKYALEFDESMNKNEKRSSNVMGKSIKELLSVTEEQVGSIKFRQFRTEGHQRLASPLYNFTFVILALTCLLFKSINHKGQINRLILAVILMILIEIVALIILNMNQRYLSLVPFIYLFPLFLSFIGVLVLLIPSFKKAPSFVNIDE